MRMDKKKFYSRTGKGVDGIEEEAREYAAKSPAEGAEVAEIVNYVINERASEKEYPNGIRDQGRNGVRPTYFATHPNARDAVLDEGEVHSLRIYTTFAYKNMDNPLRDDERYARRTPVPLPVVSSMANNAIRKLLSVRVRPGAGSAEKNVVVWRGMRNVRVSEEFMRGGGMELAFMSTSTDLRVAVWLIAKPALPALQDGCAQRHVTLGEAAVALCFPWRGRGALPATHLPPAHLADRSRRRTGPRRQSRCLHHN
jgi:hypothetical protein